MPRRPEEELVNLNALQRLVREKGWAGVAALFRALAKIADEEAAQEQRRRTT